MGLFDFFKEAATASDAASDITVKFKMDIEVMSTKDSDTEIITDMLELKQRLFMLHRYTDEERELLQKREKRDRILLDKNEAALKLEKSDVDGAVLLYEELVDMNYSLTANPYERLAIIYRKQKKYDDEIRIIKKGLTSLSGARLDSFYPDFVDRLEKAILLREKNKI